MLNKMPRSYKRKRSRKRSFKSMRRRKKRRFSRKMGIPNGMPSQTRLVNLRFTLRSTLRFVGQTMKQISIRANDAFNPTGATLTPIPAGLQPLLYDTLAKLYQKVMVVGSKATFYVSPEHRTAAPTTGQNSQVMAGVYLSKQETTPFTQIEDFINAKRGQYKALTYQRNQTSLVGKFSCKKFFNITNSKDNQDQFSQDTLDAKSEPERLAHYILYAANLDPLDTREQDLPYIVTIDMTCLFSTPRDIQDLQG